MNRCENYTVSCEAKDCCECDMFSWDGTGENPMRLDNMRDYTQRFSEGERTFAESRNSYEKTEKCKYCKGTGLIQIAPNCKGIKQCPYCRGGF